MNLDSKWKMSFVKIVIWGFILSVTTCGWFGSKKQPSLSHDMNSFQLFNDSTSFPYTADDDRKGHILGAADIVTIGMTGDNVFETLGAPDEVEVLAFPFESPRGWSWNYNLHKIYRNSTSEKDAYLQLIFDREGKISKIVRENLPTKEK